MGLNFKSHVLRFSSNSWNLGKKIIIKSRKRVYLSVFKTTIYLIQEHLPCGKQMFMDPVNGGSKYGQVNAFS